MGTVLCNRSFFKSRRKWETTALCPNESLLVTWRRMRLVWPAQTEPGRKWVSGLKEKKTKMEGTSRISSAARTRVVSFLFSLSVFGRKQVTAPKWTSAGYGCRSKLSAPNNAPMAGSIYILYCHNNGARLGKIDNKESFIWADAENRTLQ